MKKKYFSAKEKSAILLDDNTPFAIRESFNQLRTNLMYSFTDESSSPIFAITSVNEDSGKSTIITNLAYSFAQIGKKVLLIDADMRCPTLCRFFELESTTPGLSEVISGIEANVIVSDVKPNLNLVTSGRIPPNPSELLMSKRFKELLASWKDSYDIIFIDFPPVGMITDALTICSEISGYIFTVASGRDSAKEINNCIASMEQIGAKIVGIVLNDYNIKGSDSYYRNRYKYRRYKGGSRKSRYESSYKSRYETSYQSKYESSYQKQATDTKKAD